MSAYGGYWLFWLLVILGVYIWLGVVINKRLLGILIDSRCKMSLSRLQIATWTWLLISAFLAVACANWSIDIALDPEIWALMGISIGSGAGAVIVKGTKEGKDPSAAVRSAIAAMPRVGVLHQNTEVKQAKLRDMFKGEEVGDFDYIDIGKVQMFFFSVAAVAGYSAALWGWEFSAKSLAFPPLSQELVVLLGISHTGYLTIKAAPKTPTDPTSAPSVSGVTTRFPAVRRGSVPVTPPSPSSPPPGPAAPGS